MVEAGNEGEAGMGFPGAYAPVISAGSVGWIGEWLKPTDNQPRYRMWWLQYPNAPLLANSANVADPTSINDIYLSDFSSRALPGQQLDVLAPAHGYADHSRVTRATTTCLGGRMELVTSKVTIAAISIMSVARPWRHHMLLRQPHCYCRKILA